MSDRGGRPSTNVEDGMVDVEEARRKEREALKRLGDRVRSGELLEIETSAGFGYMNREQAAELMRDIAKRLGIHLIELRSIADEPMRDTKGDHVLVWNPCDGPHVGTILDIGPLGELGDVFGGNATRQWEWGPCFTHWGTIEAPPDDDQVLEELRRRFKETTGRAPWER